MTFEYTLLAGVNDGVAHAHELGALLRRHDLRSHVNVIPWNPVDESGAVPAGSSSAVRPLLVTHLVRRRRRRMVSRSSLELCCSACTQAVAQVLRHPAGGATPIPAPLHPATPLLPVAEFQRPTRRSVQAFVAALEAAGVPVSLRQTRGLEAAAACGQLRNQHQRTPLPSFEMPA